MTADPVKLALIHAIRIKEAVDQLNSRKEGGEGEKAGAKGFRSRARELPGLILSSGIVPALTFYLSKTSDDETLRKAVELLKTDQNPSYDVIDGLSNELSNKEGTGYTLMLAAVAIATEVLYGKSLFDGHEVNRVCFAKGLLDLSCKPSEERQLTRILLPYLTELKKLSDSFFGEKE